MRWTSVNFQTLGRFFVIYITELEYVKFACLSKFIFIYTPTFHYSYFINCDVSRSNTTLTNKQVDLQPAFKNEYLDGGNTINKRARCINLSMEKEGNCGVNFIFCFEICLRLILKMPWARLFNQSNFCIKSNSDALPRVLKHLLLFN